MVMVGDFLATMSLCIPSLTVLPAEAVAKGIGAQDAAFLISAAGGFDNLYHFLFQRRPRGTGGCRVVAALHTMTIPLMATAECWGQLVSQIAISGPS